MFWPNLSPKRTPSKNLSHMDSCKRVVGWVIGVKHACTCGAEEREEARLAMVKDAMRYRWLAAQENWMYSLPPMRAVSTAWNNRLRKERLDAAIDRELTPPPSQEC